MRAWTWKSLFSAYLAARWASSGEELEVAIADLHQIGCDSTSGAIVCALALIQLEHPILLALALAACGTSFVLLVQRLMG